MNPDVVIIGGGQAGIPLATRFAKAGKNVVLIERTHLGGTCVNEGCTPTKTMIASARAAHVARTAGRLGVHTGEVKVDFPAVVARKDTIVRQWRESIDRRLAPFGDRIRTVKGDAKLIGPRTVDVGGASITADIIILNTGLRPVVPPIPGLDSVPFLDSTKALDLRELPAHLVILGGGYIGCELGQMFRRFGSEVTIVQRRGHLLPNEDPEISAAIEDVLRDEGMHLELSATVESIKGAAGRLTVGFKGGKTIEASHFLTAIGRRPNTEGLGCEAAGVKLDSRGFVVVDEGYATSAPGVYAVGDVIGGPAFTHTSWDDHRLLYNHLVGRPAPGRHDRIIPFTVFTDPQIGGVGLTEREARDRGIPYEVATMPFGYIARAIELDEKAGIMKILIDPATEKILGVRLMGTEAGELVHVFSVLMQAGASARAIVDGELVHPTFGEGLQTLVMRLKRYALD